jgi:hypothetical protein
LCRECAQDHQIFSKYWAARYRPYSFASTPSDRRCGSGLAIRNSNSGHVRTSKLLFYSTEIAGPPSHRVERDSTPSSFAEEGWAAAAPAIHPVAAALPGTSLGAAAEIEASSSGSLFSEMALASMAGRAIGGTASMGRRERVGATPQAHAMSPQSSPGGPARGIAAELRELAELRNSGILTDEEFSEQKRRLLGR